MSGQLTSVRHANWYAAGDDRTVEGDVLVFDLDGVLADASHRQRFLHLAEPDWDGFYAAVDQDTPLEIGAALAAAIHPRLPVVILTGRVAAVAATTVEWLRRHGIRWDLLICRSVEDDDEVTHAVDFKRLEVRKLLEAGIRPVLAVDDNRKIVAMYEEFGIPSLYVPSGYYDDLARYDGGV